MSAPRPAVGECSPPAPDGAFRCLYRSFIPSAGIVAECRSERDCRAGHYYGRPEDATWFTPPTGLATLPRPEVIWHTANLAEIRVGGAGGATASYFFQATRKRTTAARAGVLAVDTRRALVATAEPPALVIRQMWSGREVLRLEREWTPGLSLAQALPALRFDPDGRLSFTWLRGAEREPVSERVSVPSVPR
ncbi:MAG: hypothetical protein L0027_01545 [Candidatus Rokubacteria bacterium]|nr:hypothetical protein [Candidatus Rokubacteria bacterium]